MQLNIKKGDILSSTQEIEGVDAVTVLSEDGTPLFIIVQHGGGVYLKTAEEDDFEEILNKLRFI